jgi:hypothetical protein
LQISLPKYQKYPFEASRSSTFQTSQSSILKSRRKANGYFDYSPQSILALQASSVVASVEGPGFAESSVIPVDHGSRREELSGD